MAHTVCQFELELDMPCVAHDKLKEPVDSLTMMVAVVIVVAAFGRHDSEIGMLLMPANENIKMLFIYTPTARIYFLAFLNTIQYSLGRKPHKTYKDQGDKHAPLYILRMLHCTQCPINLKMMFIKIWFTTT
jgi:hypothetical protein